MTKTHTHPFLSVKDLCVTYNKQEVLSNCSFDLDKGTALSVLGKSGCGKSTLLKTIAGLHDTYSGEIHINGELVAGPTIHKSASQRGVGMIFQDYALFPHLTVKQNITFGLKKVYDHIVKQKLEKTLALFKLEKLANRYPHELSGGQQQRVAIGRSIICEPSILLFDEPFSNLDTQTRYELMTEIKQLLADQQITSIFVTHNKTEAFRIGDKIAFLKEGYIAQCETPQNIYDHPHDISIANFFGDTLQLRAKKIDKGWFTDLGVIAFSKEKNIIKVDHDNSHASIYLRPHQISISRSCDELGFKIIDKQFNGDTSNYLVQMNQQIIWIQSHYRLNIGDLLCVRIKC